MRRHSFGEYHVLASWRKWRKSVFDRDNYRCIFCGNWRRKIAPHHILPKRDFPKLKYRVSNGATLCWKCHHKTILREYKYVKRIVRKLFGSMAKWRCNKYWAKGSDHPR